MKDVLLKYRSEMQQELEDILAYWMRFTIDTVNGGFVGKIDHENNIHPGAPKGSVLNARILWTFSAAYNLTKKPEYLAVAQRAFEYLEQHIIDKEFGGVYWTVNCKGEPLDTKKQIYALAFVVYGLTEFYSASKDHQALKAATEIHRDIVDHSYDETNGGYIEALTRDWNEIADLRLSAKDFNEKKSMNTHLHVLEAFANLYRVFPNEVLEKQLADLVELFLRHIISPTTNHLILFFDEQWNSRSGIVSYGHDIEAAWLLQEAAELQNDKNLLSDVKARSVQVAIAAEEGLDKDGGLWYEYEQGHLIEQKHSWPQAEAMIGFFNAWQNTGQEKFLRQSLESWQFVKQYIHDSNYGEWYWGVNEDYSPMKEEDKVGIWKCPYHNSRACIEIVKRINSIID